MATLQVKGLDDALYKALGARASQENRSISQEVVRLIQTHLATPGKPEDATRAFLALAGSWVDKRSAAQIIRELRKHRHSGRRTKGSGHVFD